MKAATRVWAVVMTMTLSIMSAWVEAVVPPPKDLPVLPVLKNFPLSKAVIRPRDFDTWSKKRQVWWDFNEALRTAQYATAQQFMKNCILFDEPLRVGSTLHVGGGAGIDESLRSWILNRIHFQKAGLVTDYASVFTLIKEAVDQYATGDLHLVDLYRCYAFLEGCGLWVHGDLSQTSESQRKAIRAWVLRTLVTYAEKILSSPNPLREPEVKLDSSDGQYEQELIRMVQDGAVAPNPSEGKFTAERIEKYRTEWFNWYGDVPPEIQKLDRLSIEIANLRSELIKLIDQKAAAKRAIEDAKRKVEQDPTLRK